MNREQAKKILPIIQAFAEGKIIQSIRINGRWIDLDINTTLSITRLIEEPQKYRIKPEPKYRPFKDAEECWQEMQKHQPFGWVKDMENGHKVAITRVNDDENTGLIAINGKSEWPLERLIECYTFADGTPFGIKEE